MKLISKCLLGGCLMIIFIMLLASCQCDHKYLNATCISGKVCKLCGNIEGDPSLNGGHKWLNATCVSAIKCELCGDTKGSKLGHNWTEATCQSPVKCTRCNMTQGTKKDHLWINATCDKPMTCDYCGQTTGTKMGHLWVAATCTSNQTCERCGDTTGAPLGHDWIDATCVAASKCSRCNMITGKALGHDFYGGRCRRCNTKDENFLTITNSYATYYFLGVKTAEIKASDFSYRASGSTMIIMFRVKKTYDILGSGHNEDYSFKWKLYTINGVVVDSGTLYTESLKKNEYDDGFEIVIYNIDLSENYRFELVSNSLNP